MNEENQENEELNSPVIFTIPASLTVPGFGFLVALNPVWRPREETSVFRLQAIPKGLPNSLEEWPANRE